MQDDLIIELTGGMSQSERLLRELIPENIRIDDRGPASFLQLAIRLSGQLNYYNSRNQLEGNWEDLFLSDVNVLFLVISGMDLAVYSKNYDSLRSAVFSVADDHSLPDRGWQFFQFIFRLSDRMGILLEKAGKMRIPVDIKPKVDAIGEICTAKCLELEGYRRDAEKGMLPKSLPKVHAAFSNLLIQYRHLQDLSDYYLRHNDWYRCQYAPHLGLFITFLNLYGTLQEQINQLTGRHLDFYYRTILDIGLRPEIPDKVHLLLVAENNSAPIRLPAGEEIPAELPGWDKPVKYRLTTELSVTKAKVAALRTLYTSDRPVFTDKEEEDRLLRNAQVYKGNYTCVPPDVLLKGGSPASWPLFGEDQDELASGQRTMVDTAIGLLLASPIFYLTEGHRQIGLKFYLEPRSFRRLSDYIDRFAKASLRTGLAVQNEVLTHAFLIDFTTADGWGAVDKYTVRLPEDGVMEIIVELGHEAKPMVVYQPKIHGPDHHTVLPVVRLLINNNSSHNGYSFLRDLQIERVHVRSDVKNFRHVRMQNSIGNLAVTNAFQPFGPQPVVGSNLDIRNSNVFNRYTTELAVRLEWLDLPKEPGGFATWFAGYNTSVNDASFRVGISALANGSPRPAEPLQQTFPLYAMSGEEGGSGLSTTTWIKGVDLKKLDFSNKPLLAKEEEEPDGFFRNGAIRLELLTPPEAFGHALFPKIFPEIALHNARLWNRKLPLPNQPYTPRAKSVSLHYTLEHAEAFKDLRGAERGDGGLELIHQYPFGYKKIYPGDDLRYISFLPCCDPGGNLYIGLNGAIADEELTLLFQLEEKNFHHTLHATDKVSWSYLNDDDWTGLDGKNILSDSTNGFISTGVVRMKIAGPISLQHTIMPDGLYWMRASISGAADMKSRVVAILAQAVVAERMPDQPLSLSDSASFLPPGSIKSLVRKVPGLQQVWQPFLSFGGKPAEENESYYTRISERLRHKKRPLTSQDIEQLVLEKFPSIALVKCIGTSYKRQSVYPGVDIQVILIPREGPDGSFYSDQPKVNLATLFAVKNYLAGFTSPFINIEIGNPVYEKVKIACRIRLAGDPRGGSELADAGSGYYLNRLKEDIKSYLCPWLYSPDSAIRIGTRIYIPEILTYIKKRPYISEVSGFSVMHFFQVKDRVTGELRGALVDSAVSTIEFIQGSIPEAVLIPADHHLISLLDSPDYTEPSPKGIGDLYVGDELLVVYPRYTTEEGYDEGPISREDPDEYFDLTI